MKKAIIALAASLAFASAASANDNKLMTPADESSGGYVRRAILTTNHNSTNGNGVFGNAQYIDTQIDLRACMSIAFAAAHTATSASVTCLGDNTSVSALMAVYSCEKGARHGIPGVYCRKVFGN